MNKLKITNKTGKGYDTKVYCGNTQLDCVSKIEVGDIKSGNLVTAQITFESVHLDLLCKGSTKEIIDLIPEYNELSYRQALEIHPDATIFVFGHNGSTDIELSDRIVLCDDYKALIPIAKNEHYYLDLTGGDGLHHRVRKLIAEKGMIKCRLATTEVITNG